MSRFLMIICLWVLCSSLVVQGILVPHAVTMELAHSEDASDHPEPAEKESKGEKADKYFSHYHASQLSISDLSNSFLHNYGCYPNGFTEKPFTPPDLS